MKIEQEIEIAKFWKNRKRSEHVRVSLSEYDNHKLVNIRIWFTGPDGIDRPTYKGVSLVVKRLPELAAALNKALARAQELGLLGGGPADAR
jgi:Transcriptional Coactivator p15 (PC4)